MNTIKTLSNYYQNYDEDGRLLSRHGMVEYLTTMTYIEKYLCPGMRIMEIGAATGRYSHALARKGFPVDAVELVPHNIEIFQKNSSLMRQSPLLREMLWICLPLLQKPMILHCFSDRCIIFSLRKIVSKPYPKPFVSPKKGELFLSLTAWAMPLYCHMDLDVEKSTR